MTCQCGKPTSGAFLCPRCTTTLEVAIANVAAHYADLETLRTRSTRYGDGTRASIGKELPLGVDLRFAAVVREGEDIVEGQGTALVAHTRATVVSWARVLLEEHPPVQGPVHVSCLHRSCADLRRTRHPQDTVASVCAYLLGWVRWVVGQQWAPDMLSELLDVEHQLARLVDRPADRWYAGPCDEPCGRDLYARTGARVVECPACGAAYDVAPRRAWLLAAAEDQLATAATIARAVSWLGAEPLTAERVRQWAARGQILAKSHDGDRPLYRVGDAIDLLAAGASNVAQLRVSR